MEKLVKDNETTQSIIESKSLKRVLVAALVRSHLIQAGWNLERMQNLGLAYATEGYLNEAGKHDAVKKHLEFFNTNPYLAPAVIGVVLKMEHEGDSEEDIQNFKRNMMGPLGALGDSFFWGSLRPFCVGGAAVVGLSGFLPAPLIGFIVYNIVALWLRCVGFYYGWMEKSRMITRLVSINFSRLNRLLGLALILGLSFGFGKASTLVSGQLTTVLMAMALVLGTSEAVRRRAEPHLVVVAAAVISIISSSLLL